jgi:uncharacterized RDD family membrane protein YckC
MAPGWYPDPFSAAYQRFWDGNGWTPQTRVADAEPTVAPAPSPTPQPSPAPPPAAGEPPWAGWQPTTTPRPTPAAPFALATWGSRVAARLLDWLLVGVVLLPLYAAALWPALTDLVANLPVDGGRIDPAVVDRFQHRVYDHAVGLGLATALAMVVYEVPQLVAYGRTVGKRVLGLRVRPLAEDRRPSWGEALLRSGVMGLGFLVGGAPFLVLDGLWPLWDKPWQQAIHDKAARTVVVPR